MAPRSRRLDACVALLLALAVALCWLPAPQVLADHAVDSGLKRALVSFATARTLHGLLSVAQGTEMAVQPLGLGVTFAPGRVLAPINDLTAQVADWMLWASVAFGLQKLLLAMGGSAWVSGAVSLLALMWLVQRWRGGSPPWLTRVLTVLLFARLVMPVTILGSEQLFAHFLQQPYEQSQLASTAAAQQLQALGTATPAEPPAGTLPDAASSAAPGLLERLRQWGSTARDAATSPVQAARETLTQVAAAADQLVERLVTLIVVFALQTLVIPLLLAWVLLQLCKSLLSPTRPHAAQSSSGAMPSA